MFSVKKKTIYLLLLLFVSFSVTLFARQPGKGALTIRFVAQSTAIRSAGSDNEDTYLVKIYPAGDKEGSYAKLVDIYRNFAPELPLRIVRSKSPVTLRTIRDEQCDVLFANMPIRSAPGDWMAIAPWKIAYQSPETSAIPPDTNLPCYRFVGKRIF